jgi:hypothetical protein
MPHFVYHMRNRTGKCSVDHGLSQRTGGTMRKRRERGVLPIVSALLWHEAHFEVIQGYVASNTKSRADNRRRLT